MKIGVISDTHGNIDDQVINFFTNCDQIWHAGDIGNREVITKLAKIAIVKAVYGNIDDHTLRQEFHEHEIFECENAKIWITHIGGYPNKYDRKIKREITENPPDYFICGHSHILKVMFDKKLNLMHINPGAAGNSGFHHIKTAIRFDLIDKKAKNMEILEIKRK